MPPKKEGVEPNVPLQRLTRLGSHDRPSTIIVPSEPKAMAGSLFPLELGVGDVEYPGGVCHGAISGVFEKAGAGAAATAWGASETANAVSRAAGAAT
jgi:hypothetical protein